MRRTKEDAKKTRTALLASAERLFLANGVTRTSLSQIAHDAGVTRGAVYWHFENKSDLLNQLLDQVRISPEKIMGVTNDNSSQHPLRLLRDLCVEGLNALAIDQQKSRVMKILLHRCEFTDELIAAEARHNFLIIQLIDQCEQIFASNLEILQPGVTPRMAAISIHALVIGLFTDWTRNPQLFDPIVDSGPLIDPLFRGLVRDQKII
ncbi:TetR family transcriptional regulator [Stutzerimonas stutzeri]|nr:TetR family transcriptional regulator [Stutzerimonas stutzeri]